MTDREMLEFAAKACGMKTICTDKGCYCDDEDRLWNPLTDDGDCARMEAKCGLTVAFFLRSKHVNAASIHGVETEYFDLHAGDRNVARRLASTRCAAEIGRRMSN